MNPEYENKVNAVAAAFDPLRRMPPFERASLLENVSASVKEHTEELAWLITSENGKPIRDARGEVGRAVVTFEIAAAEARRIGGEVLPLDGYAAGAGKTAFSRRFPAGPVAAITPFNFPLNLVAHKIGPALACGCPALVKPSPRTPKIALRLGKLVQQAGFPAGSLEVLEGGAEEARSLTKDPRFAVLSFTGSAKVGWELKALAGKKKVLLELGGNAAVIVHEDAAWEKAIPRMLRGAFNYAGQVCISAQRLYLHESIAQDFLKRFAEAAGNLKLGNPMEEATDLGPMIDEEAAQRAEEWVQEAVQAGARILTGGKREGRMFPPTILENAPDTCRVMNEEIFAPVITVSTYADPEDALARVNASRYGLQASLFTRDLQFALKAHREIEVGCLLINEIPGFRVDSMPYGGVKDSGFGREGIRYVIEEMTEPRLLILQNEL